MPPMLSAKHGSRDSHSAIPFWRPDEWPSPANSTELIQPQSLASGRERTRNHGGHHAIESLRCVLHRRCIVSAMVRSNARCTVASIASYCRHVRRRCHHSDAACFLRRRERRQLLGPGFFGSMAATPQQPGWSFAGVNYYTNVSASGNAAVSKEITIGQFNPALNASINANVSARADIGFFAPTYVFATPFLGGQASVSVLAAYGQNSTALNGTIAGTIGPIPFTRTIGLSQTTDGLGDLVPQFALRWNAGVNNYMAYITGDIPVGLYHRAILPTWVSATAPSTAASVTPISTRRRATNFRRRSALLAISKIRPPDTPTASTHISIWAPRSS